ncbi:MFS transporter [Streptomyces sp. NPDC051555]|uniref:MFS transporter n=1 Tax=Streptomyces sp. NPDC051555 TaxID=3365657 RepID=UPI0037B90606
MTGTRAETPGGGGPVWLSLRGDRVLATYLVGESTSLMGTSLHAVGLPVIAILYLHASATQATVLYLFGQVPNLLFTLPAGALADRYPAKPLLVGADLTAACLVAVIPFAAAAGVLSIPVLAGVALLLGTVTVLRQAAACTILPQLVAPPLLHRATSVQEAASGASSTGGTFLGTAVIAATGAAHAITLDCVSYLVSAWCTSRIPSRPRPRKDPHGKLSTEVREGALYVAHHPVLRPLALCLGGTGAGAGIISAVSSWYLLSVVETGPTGLGVIMGLSGAGYVVGALASRPLTDRLGPGRVLIASMALYPLMEVPLLLAGRGPWWVAALAVAAAVQLAAAACATATVRVVRQQLCPPELHARTQQTSTWLVAGSRPLAALAATALAATAGVWTTLLTGTFVLAGTAVALWASPVRHLTVMPADSSPDTLPFTTGPKGYSHG